MKVWRIARQRYRDQVWDGVGGLHASGRWHEKGARVVYAAEHPAVCALEVLVHLDQHLVPSDLILCEATMPEALVTTLSPTELPDGWDGWPPGRQTRQVGMKWLAESEHLALRVPSAAAPRSFNILINPLHPEAHLLRPTACEPWVPDTRLFGHGT